MGKRLVKGENDLSSRNPKLALEWNYSKNGDLQPDEIAYQSNKVVWWKCPVCSYEWQSTVNNRNKGNGCPCCSNQVAVPGVNDLLTKNHNLVLDWDYDKNTTITPDRIVPGSGKKVWWKCHICGHEWITSVASRNRGAGCPNCSKGTQLSSFHNSMIARKGSLSETHPAIANEWDYARNYPLTPKDVLPGTNEKVWWKCQACGHEWKATVHSRSSGVGCPLCANKTVVHGINDLLTLRPDLVEEWNYGKNSIDPTEVTTGSSKKVWWLCKKCGNAWEATVADRSNGRGCPSCFSRAQTSFPEQAIFYYIKEVFPDAINRYTDIFSNNNGMELDIYIPSKKMAIEYDGIAWHNSESSRRREKKKFICCRENGIKLIRVKEVQNGQTFLDGKEEIADIILCCPNHPNSIELNDVILEIASQLSITIDVNCERDSIAIREQYYKTLEENSIENLHPELIKEWNSERNGNITPNMVSAGSNRPVWWKCSKGHEWKVSPANRIGFQSGCPYCSNKKILKGFNDLTSTHPQLIREWDYENNKDITPDEITAGNCKRAIWWVCEKGHHWKAVVYSRVSGTGCPVCAGKQVLSGYNDLVTTDSCLAREWHPSKNSISPEEVSRYSNKKVWWICERGHEWEATVSNRTQGTGCPYCSNRKVLVGFNDLGTTNPELLNEWDYTKNDFLPSSIVAGSSKKVWWKCSRCGNSWCVSPRDRIKKTHITRCPACLNME